MCEDNVVTISAKYARIQTSKARNEKIKEIMTSGRLPEAAAFFKTVFSLIKRESGQGKTVVVVLDPGLHNLMLAQELLPALGYEVSYAEPSLTITW